jgi:hypothetical protein
MLHSIHCSAPQQVGNGDFVPENRGLVSLISFPRLQPVSIAQACFKKIEIDKIASQFSVTGFIPIIYRPISLD